MRAAVCILGVLALAGCSLTGGDEPSVERGKLKDLVLHKEDLPSAFRLFDDGRQVAADAPKGSRSDPARFGRVDGWKARFSRSGSSTTAGPLVIASRADLFDSESGSEEELEAALDDARAGGWQPIDEPGLGDASFAATIVQTGNVAVRHYQVLWRDGSVVAALEVNGFDGRLALAEVLALARKQQRRMARVTGT